jgi:hypothetical protein
MNNVKYIQILYFSLFCNIYNASIMPCNYLIIYIVTWLISCILFLLLERNVSIQILLFSLYPFIFIKANTSQIKLNN